MKTLLITVLISLSAQAQASLTTPEFLSRFVQTTNDRLEKTNAERTLEGSRPYCSQLSDEQSQQIEELFVVNSSGKAGQIAYRQLDQITVGQFVESVSENLYCYPISWSKGRSSVAGILFNTKAYWMDIQLVKSSLEDIAGRPIEDSESLASLAAH